MYIYVFADYSLAAFFCMITEGYILNYYYYYYYFIIIIIS